MLVVSNTSPISNLAIVGRLDLLRSQFREIWIPIAVRSELDRLSHMVAVHEIQRVCEDGWIKPQKVQVGTVVRLLTTTLDPGESEAIALARELSADSILSHEREGRNAAEHAGLRVTGVLGILLRAKRAGQIEKISPIIEALRTHARFFLSPRFVRQVLRAAAE